jgi:hypothetical protein
MRKSITPMTGEGATHGTPRPLIEAMSFRLAIPWQVALQQSLPLLGQPLVG